MEYENKQAKHTVIAQKILLTNGLSGGISLTLDLLENPSSLLFSGIGHVFQATHPVLDVSSQVTGRVLPLLTLGVPTPLYIGIGSGGGCFRYENLEFDFQLGNTKEVEGTGRFRFRQSTADEWVSVPNCKVILEAVSLTDNKVA